MSLRHPNIIQIFGGCWPPAEENSDQTCNLFSSCIVMEYAPMGSLFDVVRSRAGSEVPWLRTQKRKDSTDLMAMMAAATGGGAPSPKNVVGDSLSSHESSKQQKWDWLRQIACGMLYLHSQKNPIMHRDLKCSNVLVGSGYVMKIADFGESRRLQKSAELQSHSHAGTLLFMAPEMVTERDYDISVDVFSFAVMLVELFSQVSPPDTRRIRTALTPLLSARRETSSTSTSSRPPSPCTRSPAAGGQASPP
jgi:serine/threonine protein kinase